MTTTSAPTAKAANGTAGPAKPGPAPVHTAAVQTNLGPSEAPTPRARTPPSIHIRTATLSDAAAIADIGARVFDATFAHTCSQEDMDDYLSSNFTPEIISAEMADASKSFYVACVPDAEGGDGAGARGTSSGEDGADAGAGGRIGAFIVLNTASTEDCVEHIPAAQRIEIQRVYADPEVQGRGVAAALMARIMEMVRTQGYSYAWLGVWENNVRATKFYEKFGFARIGEHEFWLGQECQIDYIFGREL